MQEKGGIEVSFRPRQPLSASPSSSHSALLTAAQGCSPSGTACSHRAPRSQSSFKKCHPAAAWVLYGLQVRICSRWSLRGCREISAVGLEPLLPFSSSGFSAFPFLRVFSSSCAPDSDTQMRSSLSQPVLTAASLFYL